MTLELVTPVYRIEDSDERVIYEGDWKKDQELTYATFYAGQGFAKALVSFQGTSISVNAFTFSRIVGNGPRTVRVGFRIDGQLSVEHIVPYESWNKLQTVYRSPELPLGVHTLQVEASEGQGISLGLDYFQVGINAPGSTAASSSRLPIGAIVGGAVGGALSVGGLLVLWFIFAQRRQRRIPNPVSDAQPFALFHAPTISVPRRLTKSQISAALSRVQENGQPLPTSLGSTTSRNPREQQEVLDAMQTIQTFLRSSVPPPSRTERRVGEVPPPYDVNSETR
ncbi:hypothetical protein BKA70DRAFT_1266820 [Coprinopsis sp. MPI-PUGE-AT-0042]|nr:hypothetical protein BKA70DRAFT_1266820 [Coprinopsis sp. MPI-PUGE-AT-0042]